MEDKSKFLSDLLTIRQFSDSTINIVSDLLNLESIEAGAFKSVMKFEQASILHEMASNFKFYARQKGIEFTVINHLKENFLIMIDKFKIEQVIRNIIQNAVKFTPKGGNIYVTIDYRPHYDLKEDIESKNILSGYIGIQIKDTGVGIMSKNFQKVI